jgi:hypothetical protein
MQTRVQLTLMTDGNVEYRETGDFGTPTSMLRRA